MELLKVRPITKSTKVPLRKVNPTNQVNTKDLKVDLVLDSGAYSAWTRKDPIDLDSYINFALEHKDYISHVVNLDVIPGDFGRQPSPDEVEESARQSWENFLIMEQAGLKVMPVFHQGERLYWLDRIIHEAKCDYIGISPANDRQTRIKRQWLDVIFTHITDKEGWPIVKTHGFGMTALPLLFRYPWYSADSTSWALIGGYGKVLVPVYEDGEYKYDRTPYFIWISDKSPVLNEEDKHYDTLTPSAKDHIDQYFKINNMSVEDLKKDYQCRDALNAEFYVQLSKKVPTTPFKHRKKGFVL